MSDHGELSYSTAEGMDYPAHEETYKSFIKLGTIGAAVVVTVVVLLAIFLL
ncbi:aa3-type cytochrome c oxidase subunit IV [Nitrobacter sp. TKz-YC02]|uniref:aa3-type cytochrome c oxidase subunit IV n=1 Tax=Nitrobacter sp. TKz-YC02 TaxID=3398704 RepID=UPI003CEC09CE